MRVLFRFVLVLLSACAAARGSARTTRTPELSKPTAAVHEPAPPADASIARAEDLPPTHAEEAARAEPRGLASASASPPADPDYVGVIARAGLVAIVSQGLGRVLARLELRPVVIGQRFHGFRVSALDPVWAHAGLRVGDVIRRLNGQPIERPEQAHAAFESLREADELAVELIRDRQRMWLRYHVE